jgi:hypothetical protein
MSVSASVLEKNKNCVVNLKSADDLRTWMDTKKQESAKKYFMLYIYRPDCPFCKAFQREITKLVGILCYLLGDKVSIAQIEKSLIIDSKDDLAFTLAPTVPSLLTARRGTNWTRLPADPFNRTPTRLLQFLSDTWQYDALEPLESPDFDSAKAIARADLALLVDYLPERDYPVVEILKARSRTSPPQSSSQQTHDLLLYLATSKEGTRLRDRGEVALANRLFLPEEHEFWLSMDPTREPAPPVLVDVKSGKVHSRGADIFKHWKVL